MESIQRTRVNGSTLMNFLGKPVIVLGEYIKGSSSEIEIKCVDNRIVKVNLSNISSNISHQGWLEIWGTATDKEKVDCESFIELPSEFMKNFDSSNYNEYCKILMAKS